MNKHILSSLVLFFLLFSTVQAQTRVSGRRAVVVDERLSVLRESPNIFGKFMRRVGRGRAVTILGQSRSRNEIVFYRVAVSSRTRGWMQREALVSEKSLGDDEKLLRLIMASEGFDLIVRARIFLDTFPRSRLRPMVLLLIGKAAEAAAIRLSREAMRRLNEEEMKGGGAPTFSYFLNYSGLDRYNRHGIRFTFDRTEARFRYDGAAWREIMRRHPRSDEAIEARKRLDVRQSSKD